MSHEPLAGDLLADGIARHQLGRPGQHALAALRAAAAAFFARDTEWKRRHGDEPGLHGYRPYGMQFSDDPDLRDECESLAYWADQPALIPRHEEIAALTAALTAALSGYWQVASAVTSAILAGLAARYGYPDTLDFAPTSYIEVNAYGLAPGEELLQGPHEDGHLLALVVPNLPGLEVKAGRQMVPEPGDGKTMVIMPGSQLTVMTGGAIPPAYHQVRNHHLPGRLTVLYFVNTPFTGTVRPYITTDANKDTDIAQLLWRNCQKFGKPAPLVPPLSRATAPGAGRGPAGTRPGQCVQPWPTATGRPGLHGYGQTRASGHLPGAPSGACFVPTAGCNPPACPPARTAVRTAATSPGTVVFECGMVTLQQT